MSSRHVENLADRIWKLSERNGPAFGSQQFIPASTYNNHNIINENTVRSELGLAKGEDERLVNFSLGPAVKTFLIHLDLGWDVNTTRQHMVNFMQTGFNDGMLPVTLDFCNASPAFRSKAWSPASRHNFCKGQWPYLAPVVTEKTSMLTLDMEPLPFLQIRESARSGGSSYVHQIRVHKDHLKLGNSPQTHSSATDIAVKETPGPFHSHFTTEATTLLALRPLNHPNIIPCLAAISKMDKYYLLFPWATGGTLLNLQSRLEIDPLSLPLSDLRLLISQTLRQFRGILDALHHIHKMGFRHGDIKPENILVFQDGRSKTGIWKLADFGAATRRADSSGSGGRRRETESRVEYSTVRYEPPEAGAPGGVIREGDVWSLGAVMLECAIWLMYGDGEVMRFVREMGGVGAAFYVMGEREARMHPVVTDWLGHMKRDVEGQGTALGEVLGLVEGWMLTMVGSKSEGRGSPKDLVRMMDGIIAKTEHKRTGGEFLFRGVGMTKGRKRHGDKGPQRAPSGSRY
ncbi:kinase-like domain-containing protein [Immersiella caudata]|uniref:Kinase-like domain-containing protein n=1 Tax=Immersiella caudata TaxID=314043 RepID=A0AA39WSY1_9PEZI|nr:kinase-like domain-containing protein [Immersiella caudata]